MIRGLKFDKSSFHAGGRVSTLLCLITMGCLQPALNDDSSGALPSEPFSCPQTAAPVSVGTVQSLQMVEISGIAPDVGNEWIWAHNDSGDSARVFAFDEAGNSMAEVTLAGAVAEDWEDLAIDPGVTGEARIYIGDIGDNDEIRSSVKVIGFTPPTGSVELTDYDVFELSYPDEPHDAEGLAVHPITGRLYIFTKPDRGGTTIFTPTEELVSGEKVDLREVARIDLLDFDVVGSTLVTAADISADGRFLALRTYTGTFILNADGLEDPTLWLQDGFCEAVSPVEPQGEAIAFSSGVDGYYTVSEGLNPAIYWMAFH